MNFINELTKKNNIEITEYINPYNIEHIKAYATLNKKDTKLLCRIAWEDAVNNGKTGIDDWVKTTFDTKFDELKSNTSNYITRKEAERLCRIVWWDARVNFDIYETIQKWLDKEFLTIIKRIKKKIKE